MDPEIAITLTYAGQLASEAGVPEETAMVTTDTELVPLLESIGQGHGGKFQELLFDETGALRRALVVSVDGKQITEPGELSLTQACEVFIMTPMAGG